MHSLRAVGRVDEEVNILPILLPVKIEDFTIVDHHVGFDQFCKRPFQRIRDCLALPGAGGTSPARAIESVSHGFRRGAIVFLVSDFLCRGWERPLLLCARRHDVIAVRLLLPELEPPALGLLRVRDPETGAEAMVDWGRSRVREAYARRVAEWREGTARALRQAKVDLMDVPVPRVRGGNEVAGPILRFFRMRELRGAKR